MCCMCDMFKRPKCSLADHGLPPAQERSPKSKRAVGFKTIQQIQEMIQTFGIQLTRICVLQNILIKYWIFKSNSHMMEALQDARMAMSISGEFPPTWKMSAPINSFL